MENVKTRPLTIWRDLTVKIYLLIYLFKKKWKNEQRQGLLEVLYPNFVGSAFTSDLNHIIKAMTDFLFSWPRKLHVFRGDTFKINHRP